MRNNARGVAHLARIARVAPYDGVEAHHRLIEWIDDAFATYQITVSLRDENADCRA